MATAFQFSWPEKVEWNSLPKKVSSTGLTKSNSVLKLIL